MIDAPKVQKAVEFYTLEIAELADSTFGVSITATTVDDTEPELLSQELVNKRVESIDDVLAVIRDAISRAEA